MNIIFLLLFFLFFLFFHFTFARMLIVDPQWTGQQTLDRIRYNNPTDAINHAEPGDQIVLYPQTLSPHEDLLVSSELCYTFPGGIASLCNDTSKEIDLSQNNNPITYDIFGCDSPTWATRNVSMEGFSLQEPLSMKIGNFIPGEKHLINILEAGSISNLHFDGVQLVFRRLNQTYNDHYTDSRQWNIFSTMQHEMEAIIYWLGETIYLDELARVDPIHFMLDNVHFHNVEPVMVLFNAPDMLTLNGVVADTSTILANASGTSLLCSGGTSLTVSNIRGQTENPLPLISGTCPQGDITLGLLTFHFNHTHHQLEDFCTNNAKMMSVVFRLLIIVGLIIIGFFILGVFFLLICCCWKQLERYYKLRKEYPKGSKKQKVN